MNSAMLDENKNNDPAPRMLPDAIIFISMGCVHCATVLRGLNELIEHGRLGKLTVIDVAENPERAAENGVHTAPWLRLGPFTLIGSHSPAELRQWAEWASGEEGAARYVEHLLKQGGYQQAKAFIDVDTNRLKPLLAIVAEPGSKLEVRLGVSALLESHANSPSLQKLLPQLSELTHHADHRVRADACHLLGLTGSAEACSAIEFCLHDPYAEVREIAAEAMEKLHL